MGTLDPLGPLTQPDEFLLSTMNNGTNSYVCCSMLHKRAGALYILETPEAYLRFARFWN